MSNIIVIIGVTGIQGGSVADTFLSTTGWIVRGITRDPASPAAQALAIRGVQIVKGDLDDKASLSSAFQDATAIAANTDFFVHLFSALVNPELARDHTPNQYAFDRELQQNMNIAEAAASPSILKTLQRFVFSSLSCASKWSGGKYTHCYHQDVKERAIQAIEVTYPDLAAKMSLIQVGHYVSNSLNFPFLQPKKQADGSFIVPRTFGPDYKMPFVVTHKDTGAFVKALVVDLPVGKHILAVSEHMTWPAWTKLWAKTLGVEATYKQVSEDEFWEGAPEPVKKEFAETFAYVEEFGYTGGDPEVKTAEELGVKVSVTSLETYFKAEGWSSVL
ncbi:hypothetical protein LTS10_012274 [Elasticomyces elasticus]|nr:hypothetical protein LTS10_012274 [Elasticomyces elasticus]